MLAIFMNVSHPEFNVFDFLVPPNLVAGILGFVMAWLIVAVLERLRLARYVGNVSLFFIALAALLAGLTDWWLNL
jgi:high-affinity Fe2+/Pb2+ permease